MKPDATLHCIAEIHAYRVETKLLRQTTLDIITRLLDNAAFVCVHVEGGFFRVLGSTWVEKLGFQLQVEWMTTVLCAELWKEV